MATPTRVLVPIDDLDPSSLSVALGYAKAIAQRGTLTTDKIILLTHTKAQLRGTSLERHLGGHAAKALASNQTVRVGDDLLLQHATLKTLRLGVGKAVILAFYAEDRLLDFADGLSGVLGIVAVPWLEGGAKAWADRWAPIVHGRERQPPAKLFDDDVIASALESLSRMVNLSHGVLHPRDKHYADETFRILRAKGHSAPAASIKSFAIREGWKPEAAEELARLGARIFAMKTKPSLSKLHDPNGRYARWQAGLE